MKSNNPSANEERSGNHASRETSPRTVKDITNFELGSWIMNNQAGYYSTPLTLLIAFYLAEKHYNKKRGYAFPSIEYLSEKIGISERQMKRHIKDIREAKDENGKQLWMVERGYITKQGKVMANRYFPLFLDDILKGSNKKEEDLWEGRSREPIDDEPLEQDDDETFGLDEDEAEEASVDETTSYTPETLPSYVPQDVDALEVRILGMNTYDIDADPKEFDRTKRNTMEAILQYCANTKDLNQEARKELSDTLVATWRKHPETDKNEFYRRTMAFFLNKLRLQGVNTDIEQDFEARSKAMARASAMGVSYP